MTDTQPTYPDTREGLSALLVSCDAGFALYKSHHWAAQVRDIIGPWLDVHDANVRAAAEALIAEGPSPQARELAGIEPVGTEHRAVYPVAIAADSDFDTRVLPEEDARSLVAYVNRKLAAAGLPETAYVESRDLFATKWAARA